jgi:hypothetical protein
MSITNVMNGMKKPTKPAKPIPTPLVPLGFRVENEMKAALEKAAADDDRTLSSLVQKVLREWLRSGGYLK